MSNINAGKASNALGAALSNYELTEMRQYQVDTHKKRTVTLVYRFEQVIP